MTTPLVYMIRADFAPEYMDEHHAWYARRHAPDLVGAGFWSARGFDATTSPILWNVYEIPDVAIFSSEAYNGAHRADPFLETAVKHLKGRTVSVYAQLRIVDGNGVAAARYPTLRGPVLASLRLETAADDAAVRAWFDAQVLPRHRGIAGVRSVRLWEQREAHPKWPSTEPRWSVGVEWDAEGAAAAADARGLLRAAAQAGDLHATLAKVDVVTKRYALVREDLFEA